VEVLEVLTAILDIVHCYRVI